MSDDPENWNTNRIVAEGGLPAKTTGKIKISSLVIANTPCDICDFTTAEVRVVEIRGDDISSYHSCLQCAAKRRRFRVIEQGWA